MIGAAVSSMADDPSLVVCNVVIHRWRVKGSLNKRIGVLAACLDDFGL
jgi:hypothetical protein